MAKQSDATTKKKVTYMTAELSQDESEYENSEREELNQPINDDKQDSADKNDNDPTDEPPRKKRKVHKLSLTRTENFNEKLKKRGVIYVARVPPRMNPTKLKTLLSDFGEVTRVYLVEEDKAKRKRRRKATGNNGCKRYIEGWVEYQDKSVAKHVARSLNNTPISNHKRNVHYGELWNLKYLHKFKWSHLTEKVAYERRVREQKLRIEMMQARRENASYTQLVETGKKLDKIEARKKKRGESGGLQQKKKRRPKQTKPVEEGNKAAKHAVLSSLV